MNNQEGVIDVRPGRRRDVIDFLTQHAKSAYHGDFDVVASPNTASIFLGSLVAERLRLPMVYARPKPKGHGKHKRVEGRIRPGDRVLVVSDAPTRADVVVESIAAIEDLGGHIACCLTISADDEPALEKHLRPRNAAGASVRDLPGSLTAVGSVPTSGLTDSGDRGVASGIYSGLTSELSPGELEASRRRVALALLQVGAVTINRREPFTYTSGMISPIYTDCRLLMSNPSSWTVVIDAFVDLILHQVHLGDVDVLSGTATSGIPHAALIASRLDLPMAYVTFENLQTGPSGEIKGCIKSGDRVVMIEDHVTTGKSVLTNVDAIRQHGANVGWCIAIFSYGSPVAQVAFSDRHIEYATLCDLETLLKVAKDHGYIGTDEEDAVRDWLAEPASWSERERARRAMNVT